MILLINVERVLGSCAWYFVLSNDQLQEALQPLKCRKRSCKMEFSFEKSTFYSLQDDNQSINWYLRYRQVSKKTSRLKPKIKTKSQDNCSEMSVNSNFLALSLGLGWKFSLVKMWTLLILVLVGFTTRAWLKEERLYPSIRSFKSSTQSPIMPCLCTY